MKKKILLAEDEELNRIFIKEILELNGDICDTVANGALALEKLKQTPYDVLLLDINMPILDGLSTIRKILKDEDIQPKPILIAVTASSGEDEIENFYKEGFLAVLSKPFSIKALKEILARFETGSPGWNHDKTGKN